jgi:hypothetical protein
MDQLLFTQTVQTVNTQQSTAQESHYYYALFGQHAYKLWSTVLDQRFTNQYKSFTAVDMLQATGCCV